MALSASLSEMQQPLQVVKVPCNLINGSKGIWAPFEKKRTPKISKGAY